MKLNYILSIFILFLLSSCNDNKPCIAADDFGFDKFEISSHSNNIYGERENQYIDWTTTALETSGDPIFIVVNGVGSTTDETVLKYLNKNSRWAPLYCEKSDDRNKLCRVVDEMNVPECIQANTRNSITNPLCVFKNGVGLFGLLVPSELEINNINDSKTYNLKPPKGCTTFHLGATKTFDHNGASGLGGYRSSAVKKGQSLYFKILDRFYEDNSGSYEVIIKNGFQNSNGYPISNLVSMFKNKMNQISESIFKNTIRNSSFTTPLKLTVTLYIIILVIGFMFGLIQITHKEVLTRLLKIIIVIQLLTGESSYTFFKDYFFTFFVDGFEMAVGFVTSGLGNSDGMNFFDLILGILLSYETNSKIMAYFFSIGFLLIPLLYIFIAIFIIAIFRAVVLYITSYVAITLLIAISPLFLVFMLFQFTNSFFQNWLKQFGNYFFQPLIVFAAITLFSVIIMTDFYKILGNRVCYNTIFSAFDTPIIKFWQYEDVAAYREENTSPIQSTIDIPGYSLVNGQTCAPYMCRGNRFINAPFLNPDDLSDAKYAQAKQLKDYGFLIPKALYLILLSFLLNKLFDILPSIAKGIAGTEFNQADLSQASSNVISALKSVASSPFKAAYTVADIASNGRISAKVEAVRQEIKYVKGIIHKAQDSIGGRIDKITGNEFDVKPQSITDLVNLKINKTMSNTVGKAYDTILTKTDRAVDRALGIN